MARSAAQNDSFCRAKRAVFACRMSHFESPKNVKKTQVAFSQRFRTFSYFARTRPSVFYFGKMACISYNKCYFVSIIQHSPDRHLQRKKHVSHPFPFPNRCIIGAYTERHQAFQEATSGLPGPRAGAVCFSYSTSTCTYSGRSSGSSVTISTFLKTTFRACLTKNPFAGSRPHIVASGYSCSFSSSGTATLAHPPR